MFTKCGNHFDGGDGEECLEKLSDFVVSRGNAKELPDLMKFARCSFDPCRRGIRKL